MGVYFEIYISSSFLYIADMVPILKVTPMKPSFPQELQTSKRTGASLFDKCL